MLYEKVNPIPGFTQADCDQIKGDFINKTVSWKSGKSVKTPQGKAVRLKFEIQNAKLYVFEFKN